MWKRSGHRKMGVSLTNWHAGSSGVERRGVEAVVAEPRMSLVRIQPSPFFAPSTCQE